MAGKTVLITGASAGIGKAAAVLFHERGWNVIATMRTPAMGRDLAALEQVLVTALDVTDEGSIQAAVKAAEDRFSTIDVLVNNAGYGVYGLLEATSVESIRKQFETNVVGLLATTKAVLPGMRKQKSGLVINVGSIAGRMAYPLAAMYCRTKFALEGISEALRFELCEIGVHVKLIEPGIIYTNFANVMEFNNDTSLTEYQRLIGRFGETMGQVRNQGTEVGVAAKAIFAAAIDNSDRFRYLIGEDAKAWAAELGSMDPEEYFAHKRATFGL